MGALKFLTDEDCSAVNRQAFFEFMTHPRTGGRRSPTSRKLIASPDDDQAGARPALARAAHRRRALRAGGLSAPGDPSSIPAASRLPSRLGRLPRRGHFSASSNRVADAYRIDDRSRVSCSRISWAERRASMPA